MDRDLGVTLNTRSDPFDRLDARRAVAYALERGDLALGAQQTFGRYLENPVTCQVTPPNIPGYVPYCPFTEPSDVVGSWARPDTSLARGLVGGSGTGGAHVVVAATTRLEAAGEQVAATLDDLGYQAELRIVDSDANALDRGQMPPDADVSFITWGATYASGVEFFVPLLGCLAADDDESYNLSNFCDPEVDQRVKRALDLQETDRYRRPRLSRLSTAISLTWRP